MKLNVNKRLEVPLGKDHRLFLYVQCYNDKKCQINVYYYDRKPYDGSVNSETEAFSFCITFRI